MAIKPNVRFGSEADISQCKRHVRCYSNSGHVRCNSLDNLVSERNYRVRHGEIHRFGGFQVEHEQVVRRLFNRQSAGFAPLKMRSASAAARSKDSRWSAP